MPELDADTLRVLLMDPTKPWGIVNELLHYRQATTKLQSVSSKDPIIPGSLLVLSCPFQDFSRSLSLPEDRPDLEGLPDVVINALRSGACHLVIDGAAEGWAFEPVVIERFHEMLAQFGVSPKVVTLLTQNRSFSKAYTDWSDERGILDKIQVICGQLWIPYIARQAVDCVDQFENAQHLIPSKKYVCLNSRPRLHRILLLCSLIKTQVLDEGYVSFGGFKQAGDLLGRSFRVGFEPDDLRRLYPPLSDEITYLEKRGTLIADISPDQPALLNTEFALPLYQDSYFTIVAESDFTNGSVDRVTEKILKPILGKHPFIIVGNPFSLERVRDMGFKTFAPYIDESYDQITDPALRFKSVTAEIQRLTTLPHQQLKKLCETLHDVTKYNYDYLTNEFVSGWCRSAVLKVESDLKTALNSSKKFDL